MGYIHQREDWPHFAWDTREVECRLAGALFSLGRFPGRLDSIGLEMQDEAVCEMLCVEMLNSSAAEGEKLNREDVRSGVARGMALTISAKPGIGRRLRQSKAAKAKEASKEP